MPCTDGGVPYPSNNPTKKQRKTADKAKIDLLTAMLCSLCSYVDSFGDMKIDTISTKYIHPELPEWWEEHQAWDVKRKTDIKNKVLARLTEEEKEVLGLK